MKQMSSWVNRQSLVSGIVGGLVIAIPSAFLGAYFTYTYVVKRQFAYESSNTFFQMRNDLRQRLEKLVTQKSLMQEVYKQSLQNPSDITLKEKMAESNAEFNVIANEGMHFFGPKTAELLQAIPTHSHFWWEVDDAKYLSLVWAMTDEEFFNIFAETKNVSW